MVMAQEDRKEMAGKVCEAWQEAVKIALDVREGLDEPCFPNEEGELVTGRQYVERMLDYTRPDM
jgi:hypothetical protein